MPVRLRSTVTPLKEENTTQKVFPLWLESTVKSEHPRALVGADCDGGSLAPDASAVLYLSQGAAWVALLTRLPREQMLAQLRAAQRQEAVSKARQIATGLMMYVQDYDETYPPSGEAVITQIRPYVRDSDVFVAPGENEPGFVYLFSARTTNSIKNPATQELGYLPGPGGRAMIYADGHVEWRSDNQSPGEPAREERRRGYFR